ncbi:MAG: hypothetical protein IT186_08660 [Acidobacteria bacterium]|nr:hypothetical protein [Acidobacteriota bacterium]MCG3192014.1 Ribosomal RNA small subunit methyltransferase B [Thermoanaerobaculia bacterium]
MTSVRVSALDILARTERGAHAAPLLESRMGELSPLDRTLLRTIVKTVLRNQLRLDHVLARSADRPLGKTDPHVRAALRAGAAQLLLLDRIPRHAAVRETVEALRRFVPRATGFVNAILRKVADHESPPGRVELPASAAAAERLSITYSHPRWLVDRWIARFGEETAAGILESDNADSPIDLLADPATWGSRDAAREVLHNAGLEVVPSPWAPLALTVRRGNPFEAGLFFSRDIVAVDAAAQGLLEVAPEVDVALDLAAAPGGKTRTLLARGKARGVIGVEPHFARMMRLRENLRLAGRLRDVRLLAADGRRTPLGGGRVPLVVLDAPCSGTGTLRKNPEKRYILSGEDLVHSARVQRELLEAAMGLVAPGGLVIYVTCSLEREENRDVADATVSRRDDCEILSIRGESLPEPFRPWIEANGTLTLPPGAENDGFSMTLVRKREKSL